MNYTTLITTILFPLILILIIGLYISFQKLKNSENQALQLVYLDLDKEKNIKNQLKSTSEKITSLENSTQEKILKIKVGIFNIDFTLSEIF